MARTPAVLATSALLIWAGRADAGGPVREYLPGLPEEHDGRAVSAVTGGGPGSVWMTHAARLLRAHDLAASSANIIEATRLADALATLRGMALPGIDELREAAVAVLCAGGEKPLELIDRALVVGDVLGAVPDDLPVPPLKADFEAECKSCRLDRSTEETDLQLDLREMAHLRKSRLLHRLALLDIPWGKAQPAASGKHGRRFS